MLTNKNILIVAFVLTTILLVRVVSYYSIPEEKESNITVDGFVENQPQLRFNKIYFTVSSYQVVSSSYTDVSPGDKVRVQGEKEKNLIKNTKVEKLSDSTPQGYLIKLREELVSRLSLYLPTKESALLSGILLGSKTSLSREIKDKLVSTGTMHVVVVSGYNIVLVGSFFLVFARYLGRRKTTLIALTGILCYSLLVGLEAPTLRALIMGSISLLAVLTGRKSSALYSLLIAVFLMLFIDPANLASVSFQLSLSATLGIIVFTNVFLRLFIKVPNFFREVLSSTIAAQILVIPLIFYHFGNVSLLSPLVNTLILWTIPIGTFLGVVLLLLSFASSFIASLVSTFVYIPLKIFFVVVESFAELKIFFVEFDSQNFLTMVGYYLIVIALTIRFRQVIFAQKNHEPK